ncbi:hypothetical protein NGF19_13970 [Streptomyces sp. RY43-2]|uniref:Uncharacterized protein n=1 Tax=Streptomyces macrolidinus TaxID=2952607 RepID=A0ABT0ZE68_9ACTN|nr:hypothetical protein [Streptomyces macrolidinus]MCN9241885.1 hypothetical protein [Streptomyces macrolidinus]
MTDQYGTVLVGWTTGTCWKCERVSLPVTWVGPARYAGQDAPIYLCQYCLAAVERRARSYFLEPRSEEPPSVIARPYARPVPLERNPMNTTQQSGQPALQFVTISVSGFGIRARADGRTGLDAWRIIRQRHPRVTWAVGAYALLLAGLVAAVAIHLVA